MHITHLEPIVLVCICHNDCLCNCKCAKTLIYELLINQEEGKIKEEKKWEKQTHTHIGFKPFLQILNLDHCGLHHWLEMVTTPL